MALWQDGGYFDGGWGRREAGGSPGVSPTTERETRAHTQTHRAALRRHSTDSRPFFFFFLPWAFSTNTTLESCWKLCPSRSILSPPEAGHVSKLCLSTSGSSWADLWAAWGRRESANTHPLPMQTWASRLGLNHYLDSFHRAAGKTSTSLWWKWSASLPVSRERLHVVFICVFLKLWWMLCLKYLV